VQKSSVEQAGCPVHVIGDGAGGAVVSGTHVGCGGLPVSAPESTTTTLVSRLASTMPVSRTPLSRGGVLASRPLSIARASPGGRASTGLPTTPPSSK
jgi:hypothetical protein